MLGLDENATIGALVRLWCWCGEYALDGDLARFSNVQLALVCGWPAKEVDRCIGRSCRRDGSTATAPATSAFMIGRPIRAAPCAIGRPTLRGSRGTANATELVMVM